MRPIPTLLALSLVAVGAGFASTAHAAEGDDRFTLRLGAMNIDTDNTIRGSTNIAGQDVNLNEDFSMGGKEWEPRVDGVFRFSDRQRLIFDYFKWDKDRREVLNDGIAFGDINVPEGSFVKAELKYQVATLVYDYSVVDTDRFDLGLQIGAEWAQISAKGYADLGNVYNGRFLDEKENGVAPVVGARLTFNPADRWMINLQGQYLNTSWGSFDDYEGDLSRANAIVEYRLTDNFGLFAGYDWFKLDVDQKGSDGVIGLKQEFKGPVAGVSLSF
ncbi:opacity protein-like surface antigen [Stenotrophomonas sp. SORGH_AS321]|nr:opacity protein-like surface antigen [Stenotrophomonas sp. SORGH_AS_0321]